MVPVPGMAFFSTRGGQFPPRPVPEPPNAPIVRDPISFQSQVLQHSQELRNVYPHECNQVFKGFFDIGDYFDPLDRQVLGTQFLQEVLNNMAAINHEACSVFAYAWASQNQDKVNRVKNGECLLVFSEAEIHERGRMFLLYALKLVRDAMKALAKSKAKADSGQAKGTQPDAEVGRGTSPPHTLPKETAEVELSTSQPQTEDDHKGSVSLAHSPPPEDHPTDQGQPANSGQVSSKESPKSETQVPRSNESEKKQEIAQTSASSPGAAKSSMLVPPTPKTTESSPAVLANNDQKRSTHKHVKSQASTHRGPGFNPRRGTQGPLYQSPGPVWMGMQEPRNSHPPAGFMSPPPFQHNSLDQMVMAGPSFVPMQTQPMMSGAPFANQWQHGMPNQQYYQGPPRSGHRNSVDPPPMFISNTLKADLSRQATPQMQNAYLAHQPPFVQQTGAFGPHFTQTSPYPGNATLGNMTNMENQFGPQVGNRRHASASRNDYLPPSQVQRDDGVFQHQSPNDFIVQPARDRRSSFAGPPGRKSRRGSFRGGHAGAFHDRHPSDNILGTINLQNAVVNTEPFPPYMSPHNPFTVYVSNFPDVGSENDHAHSLRTLFSNRIGKTVEKVMVRVGKTGKRYALISFFHANDVQEALKLHSTDYMGMRLQVNPKDVFPYHHNGSLGHRNTQSNARGNLGNSFQHDSNFFASSAKVAAGNNQPFRNWNTNDRRSFTNGKNRTLNTKYSPQDARSTIPTQDPEGHLSGMPHHPTAETGIHSRDGKKAIDGGTAESKSGRSTPSNTHQGSSHKAKKKVRREEAAGARSEGGNEKIKTIEEETNSQDRVEELTLNTRNELVDESGKVIFKVKVDDKGEGKAIVSGKSSDTARSKEQSKKDSAKPSGSRQQSLSTTRSASVGSSKTSKRVHGGSPAPDRQRWSGQNHEPEPTSTLNSQSSSVNVGQSKASISASVKAQDHHESAPKVIAASESQKTKSANRVSYSKAAANVQTPEKGTRKNSMSGVRSEKVEATPDTPTTVIGTPGPTASPEGDESFVTAQEDVSVTKKDKHGRQNAPKKRDGKRSLPNTTPHVHVGEQPFSASSPATVVGPSSTNKWVELTPRVHSTADSYKPEKTSETTEPKDTNKSEDIAGSEDVETSAEMPIPGGSTNSGEGIKSAETICHDESTKSDKTVKSVDSPKFSVSEAPESTELPKVEKTPEAGNIIKDNVARKSNASDSTTGEEQFFTPPPQKAEFDVPENPMQERSTNVEVSTSKSGPKQTSSIHPYARQKDQKKKKTKKNKKEQHKGPLHASKTTNAMIMTTEAHQQVLFEHLSSDNSLSQKDDKIQQVKSHQSILDSRLRNSIPTSQQETHETKLTPKFSIAPESGRSSVVESGSIVTDGLDSTLYATSLSDGGRQSGDIKVEIPQMKDRLGTDQHIMDGEDVWQQSSVTEGAPAGEPGESAGSLRIAEHTAGEFQNREETSNAESSRGSLDSAQPSAVEGSETYNSDAADEFLIRLNAKRRANEKTRLKAKAKRDRQRAEKRAQEEQESKLRAEDGPQKDPEVYDKRIRVSTPYVSSDDEEDQIEVLQCGTQYEAFRPHLRVASPKDTPHALSGDQKFKDLCSGAIGALQELGIGGPTTSNYAVPALLSESDSSDSLEFCDTATTNSMKAGKEFPHPFPHPTRLNGKVGNQAQSSLDLRGAQCTSSKSQHNDRIVDCVRTSSQSSPPSKKQEKRKGKCCAHEMDEPEEASNAPGKPSAPHSFYDDFEIDADKQSESQRDATILSDPMSPPGEDDAEQARKISQVVAALAGLRALHTVEVSIHKFVGSAGDGTFSTRTEGNAEDSGRVGEELEEAGGVQVAKDDGDAAEAAAGGSKRKTSKKKSKQGKKKGRKW